MTIQSNDKSLGPLDLRYNDVTDSELKEIIHHLMKQLRVTVRRVNIDFLKEEASSEYATMLLFGRDQS